jgi:hypothetical protein
MEEEISGIGPRGRFDHGMVKFRNTISIFGGIEEEE